MFQARSLFGTAVAVLALSILTAGLAQAQVDLAITQAEAGWFEAGAGCSHYSPQFSNDSVYSGPVECVASKRIWVTNKGTAASQGTVTVRDFMNPEQPKGTTVVAVNGYCAFPGGCGVFNQNANGWSCSVAQGSVSCTRSDSLPVGSTYPPIVVRLIREDFSPLLCFNDLAIVSGGTSGGLVDTNLGNNTVFDDSISWPLNLAFGFSAVTIHTVPEGQVVSVDGSLHRTPHTFFWRSGELHSVVGDNNGAPWPGNEGLKLTNVSVTGALTQVQNNRVFWQFPIVAAGVTPYEQLTFIYTQ